MTTTASGLPIRVLLVEDSEDDAFLLERAMRKGGYEPDLHRVERLGDLQQALEQQVWDVVISDYNLPGFCALDVLRALRTQALDLPFIVVSGAIGEETAVEAMHAGAHDYIMKDNLTRLNSALEREMAEAEGRRQRRLAEHALRESEEHFRQLAGNIDGVMWLIDVRERRMIYVNPRFEMVWEQPASRLFDSLDYLLETVHPEDYDRVAEGIDSDGWVGFNLEYRIVRPDGETRWVNTRSFPIRDENGAVYRCAALTSDTTERKRFEAEREKLFRALEQTADMVMITNREGVIEYVNVAFEDVTGYNRDSVVGRKPGFLSSGLQDEQFFDRMWSALSNGLPFTDLFINRRRDGDLYYEAKTITPVRDERGEVTHFVATGKDVTRRLARQEAMQHMVSYDALTGLGNRLLFVDHLNKSVMNARRVGGVLGVLCIGLDLEELLGQNQMEQLGERMLFAAGQRIKQTLRQAETLARLEQQAFAALMGNLHSRDELEVAAQRLIDAFSRPLESDGYELYVNLSVGISVFPEDSDETDDLIKQAEAAMRHARSHARTGYDFYRREMALAGRRKGLRG